MEDPKSYLRRLQAALERHAKKCFYYPCCGSDFSYPLRHFSKWCNNFIFCDWMPGGKGSFLDQINAIQVEPPEGIPVVAPDSYGDCLHRDKVYDLANIKSILREFFPQVPSTLSRFLVAPSVPEKQYAELWITDSEGETRFVRVSWLAMEGVNIYWKLFTKRRLAPRILCLKHWGGDDESWTPFGEWEGHLRQLVQNSCAESEFLVARKRDHNWPWKRRVAKFTDWDEEPVVMWAQETKS